jgi:hypothetical protein
MPRPDRVLEAEVIRQAQGRCEYCHFPVAAAELPFHIDHIIAEKHGGLTDSTNLAWAWFSCNMHKGPNIAGLDPETSELTRLFNPRSDPWPDHFEWDGACMRGKTAVGRTTITVLQVNVSDSVAVREALRDEGMIDMQK